MLINIPWGILWWSSILDSVLPPQRLSPDFWLGSQDPTSHSSFQLRGLKEKKRQTNPQTNGKSKIEQARTKPRKHTHTKETKTEPKITKNKRTTRQTKEPQNEMKQLRTKLTKDKTKNQNQSIVPAEE